MGILRHARSWSTSTMWLRSGIFMGQPVGDSFWRKVSLEPFLVEIAIERELHGSEKKTDEEEGGMRELQNVFEVRPPCSV